MTKESRPMQFDEAVAAGIDPYEGELQTLVIPPRLAPEVADDDPMPSAEDEERWASEATFVTRPPVATMETMSDTGNAERWCRMFGDSFRYNRTTKDWLHWNGRHWAAHAGDRALWTTKAVARSFLVDVADAADAKTRHELVKHASFSESAGSRARMLVLAAAEPGIGIDANELDANPWLLNAENGTVNLMTGALNPHSRADLCTRTAPVTYDPDALCPEFDAFLESSLPDPEVREWLMRFFGYSLTGVVREHIFPILWGAVGRNGKGTLIETVFGIMGDMATPVPNELIIDTKQEQHPTIKAQLLGIRLAVGAEIKPGDKMNEPQVKHLTGGDTIRARFMRQDLFSFAPTHKLLLQANYKPKATVDPALWARVRVVPFMVSFLGREDLELKAKLAKERSGILNRLIRACLAWNMHGLGRAQAIDDATASYQADSDTIGLFLGDCTVRDAEAMTPAGALYGAYRRWCEDRGERAWTNTSFGVALSTRKLEKSHTRSGKVYRGLRLNAAVTGVTGSLVSATNPGVHGGYTPSSGHTGHSVSDVNEINIEEEASDEDDSYWDRRLSK